MKHTLLPASTSNTIPEPYSHGYLYGSSSYALVDAPYPADLQLRPRRGAMLWAGKEEAYVPGETIGRVGVLQASTG
jgi:hypothetical protein